VALTHCEIVRSLRVRIDAPASLVWRVLLDLSRYAEWNEFNPRIESTLALGAAVVMDARNPLTGEVVEVTEYLAARVPERLLAWEQPAAPGSADSARRDQFLEPLDSSRCVFFHTDRFFGPGAAETLRVHGAWVKAGFDLMALDLKARAEGLAR
jgi:uncharacterized protein YndB with AHSA1/START domain